MFNINKLIGLVGAPKDNFELNEFFHSLGHSVPQQLPKGEDSFYICDFERGLEFVFEDEATFLCEGLLGSGKLNFSNFFLRSEYFNDDDYKPYTGNLPKGLLFTMSQKDVREVLGNPDIIDNEISLSDSWELEKIRMTIEYTDDGAAIQQVTVMDAKWFRRFTEDL